MVLIGIMRTMQKTKLLQKQDLCDTLLGQLAVELHHIQKFRIDNNLAIDSPFQYCE